MKPQQIKPNTLNPFLEIKLQSSFGFLLCDLLNKKTFELNNSLIRSLFGKIKNNSQNVLFQNNIKVDASGLENILYSNANFWIRYNALEALAYHAECYRYPFLQYEKRDAFETDNKMMQEYSLLSSPPSLYKKYTVNKIKLEETDIFPKVKVEPLMRLESQMNNLSAQELRGIFSKFSYVSFGEIPNNKKEKKFIRKTVPSGGAKHPTEAYFIFPKNSFFPTGVYHYDVEMNALDLISNNDEWSKFEESTYNTFSKNMENKFAVIYSSVVERAMYRYRDIRSTRAILADVGHVIQNSKLIGCALGLLSITEYKLKSKELKEILKIEGDQEILLGSQVFFTNICK